MSRRTATNQSSFPPEKQHFTTPSSFRLYISPYLLTTILSELPLSESPSLNEQNHGWVYLRKKRGTQVGHVFRFANPCKQSPFRYLQGLSGIRPVARRKLSHASIRNPNALTACASW